MSIDFNKSLGSLKLVDLATRTAMTNSSTKSMEMESSRKLLDLIVELDYLGQVDVESKYLQVSIIPWLIGQIKLVDQDKQIRSVCLEVNVKKNSFYVYKKEGNSTLNELLNHRLTEMFKLTSLPHDPPYFGYFYRKNNTSFNYYTFHVFCSNKSNLSQVLIDFQTQALKVHDNTLYEKLFDFKLVTKMKTTKHQLNIPNFIEICLDKLIKNKAMLSEKNSRVMLKFGTTKLFIQELDKEPLEREYKNVLYLNNSITNENYFCLAYSSQSPNNESTVDAMILYSKNVELIDDVIREYAINVSSELSNADLALTNTSNGNLSPESNNNDARSQQHTCLYCPMQQFINLCEYVYQKTGEFTYDVIIDKLNYNLDHADQNYLFGLVDEFKIDVDFKSNEQNLNDVNLFLMALLHKLCLKKQAQHLIDVQSKSISHKMNFNLMLVKHSSPYSRWNKTASSPLARSNTIHTTSSHVALKNKKNGVLTKITGMIRPSIRNGSVNGFVSVSSMASLSSKMPTRKAIFNKIVAGGCFSSIGNSSDAFYKKKFNSSQEIRRFWKKVISEQIILLKMLKDNQAMHLSSQTVPEHEFRRQESINYAEITPCLKEAALMWDKQFSQVTSTTEQLLELVLKGVPREMRERVWIWLSRNHTFNVNQSINLPGISYSELVKQTTIHQHAILLDLGRTFPSHVNFERKFGTGQQALFNVLKAYSIFDHEVGYCQGMSFIVGILLIHSDNDEEKAYNLLKHILVNLDFRQQYKPDMVQLQRYMYQFSRLLEARLPDLFAHFELNDVTSSLYAAPWFLTLYSSQFQIGFVARVFDFVFVEGVMALFKISLAILHVHRPILLSCDTFESIVNHLKTDIPEMSLIECELIISKAYSQAPNSLCQSLTKDLEVYEIEFNILYEEYANLMSLNSGSVSSSSSNSQPALTRANTVETGFDFGETEPNSLSNGSTSMEQLKSENIRLRRESKELRESLHSLQLQLFNSDEQFFKLFNENKQLKCKIEVLEIERNSCLKKVNDQEKLIRSFQLNGKSFDDN